MLSLHYHQFLIPSPYSSSVNCVQKLLRPWPAMLLSSALTMQNSTCSEAISEPPGLTPEQASREETQSSYWSLLQEEFATMLR